MLCMGKNINRHFSQNFDIFVLKITDLNANTSICWKARLSFRVMRLSHCVIVDDGSTYVTFHELNVPLRLNKNNSSQWELWPPVSLEPGMAKLKETTFPAKRCRVLRLTREDDKMLSLRLRNLTFLSGRKNWRKESQRKPKKRMTMEGTHNSNFAPHRQDPRGNPMNKGITNEIGKLCANSGGVWAW